MKKLLGVIFFILGVVSLMHSQANGNTKKKWGEKEIDALIKKSELIPVQVTGDKDNRINVVIMNQWTASDSEPYNSPKMRTEFLRDIEESLIAALNYGDERAKTAYANYKEFFNVYGLWVPDVPEWKKGIDVEVVDAIRDKLFLPWKNEHKGWVTFLIMPNRDKGGGGAARNLEKRFGTAVIAGNGIGKMLHEISHTCMSLGDEYTTGATGTNAFPTYSSDLEYERNKIKWRKWIEPTTPLPTPYQEEYIDKVGAFEGNQYHLVGYYRSTAQGCIMGAGVFDNTEEMCPICDQRVAMRVYDLVDPINGISPENTSIQINGKTKLHFSVDHIVPEPNTQIARWFLNGKIIASGVDEVEVELGAISKYELICSITDETPYIKPDPPYAKFPKFEVKWNISNTAPTSSSGQMGVKLHSKQMDKKSEVSHTIKPTITGGAPPYSYRWSMGSANETLENVGMGIYDVVVVDSEYRMAKAHYSIYESSLGNHRKSTGNFKKAKKKEEAVQVKANVKASEIGKNNGAIALSFNGGLGPYRVQWKNAKYEYGKDLIYEPENATIETPDYKIKTLSGASNNSFVDFKGREGSISWEVEVANSGIYPMYIIYGGIYMKGSSVRISINGTLEDKAIHFNQTRPLFTGWDSATATVFLKEGINKVTLISSGQSIPNIDYLRVPSSVKSISVEQMERINLSPGDYGFVVTDGHNNTIQKTVTVPEVYPFEISNIKIGSAAKGAISIVDPLPGYTYKWYANDAPLTKVEKYEKPLSTGAIFFPTKRGDYYVAAQNDLSKAESSNRIGFAVDDMANKKPIEIDPSELGYESIKLWFDASDIDGNGKEDIIFPERGPVKAWKDRLRRSSNELFIKYEPNRLNGKGVAAFDHVWVSTMKKEVKDYQTIIMVYKESSMSFAGTTLFRGLNDYLGKSKNVEKALFDKQTTDEKTKNGKVYLNGEKIDPFITPNPMDFCTLIVELESKSEAGVARTEGLWEGSIAEMILVDRVLTDWERKGIEEYLRRKWFSSVDVDF